MDQQRNRIQPTQVSPSVFCYEVKLENLEERPAERTCSKIARKPRPPNLDGIFESVQTMSSKITLQISSLDLFNVEPNLLGRLECCKHDENLSLNIL